MYSPLRQIFVFVSIASIASTTPLINKSEIKRQTTAKDKASEEPIGTNATTASPNTTNKERNWLLTKAWLIDNINRLRHEFNELERDYNHHIDEDKTMDTQHDKKLVQEMTTLRADHIVLSQQQKQIIELIKKNQYNGAVAPTKQQWFQSQNSSPNSVLIKKRHKKRDSPHLKSLVQKEQTFEEQTKRNMTEVFAEMSALHDITISIFEDLMDLQKRVNQKP